MSTKDKVIEELVSLILMQEQEIDKLREDIIRLKQYMKVYEEYIQGG